VDDRAALASLESRLRTLLPEEYRDSYEDVQPTPMRSAGLKYDAKGLVAWDQIWGSFCDLAMAGGPPHKGTLLEPGRESDIDAHFDRYDEVADEISRGIRMAAGLRAYPAPTPGWVAVTCAGDAMAGWLVRAIVMENVAARCRGSVLELPAAPHFRLEKEIKNVVTVTAKTCHYWVGHMPPDQQRAVAELLAALAGERPLIEPAWPGAGGHRRARELVPRITSLIHGDTGLRPSPRRYAGWLGLECPDVRSAVWMMRALVTTNVLSRREDAILFVPVNAATDPDGTRVASAVAHVHRCLLARVLAPSES
jgi:hypothetical protein